MSDSPKRVRFLSRGGLALFHRRVLASLPGRWRMVDAGPVDAVFVDGEPAATEEAIRAGAKTIVIGDPTRLGATAIESVCASDATVVAAAELVPRLWANGLVGAPEKWSTIESTAIMAGVDELPTALFEQLSALRVIAGGNGNVSMQSASRGSYVVRVDTRSGAAAILTGLACGAQRREFSIDAVALDRRLEIEIDLASLARPASIIYSTAVGSTRATPVHQSGHRLMWEQLASDGADRRLLTLATAAGDLKLVSSLLAGDTND